MARAYEFERRQKFIITIVLTIINSVVVYYFYDAYNDMNKFQIELIAQSNELNSKIIPGGISDHLVSFVPMYKFIGITCFVWALWA